MNEKDWVSKEEHQKVLQQLENSLDGHKRLLNLANSTQAQRKYEGPLKWVKEICTEFATDSTSRNDRPSPGGEVTTKCRAAIRETAAYFGGSVSSDVEESILDEVWRKGR